jgi:hypothetical protein
MNVWELPATTAPGGLPEGVTAHSDGDLFVIWCPRINKSCSIRLDGLPINASTVRNMLEALGLAQPSASGVATA